MGIFRRLFDSKDASSAQVGPPSLDDTTGWWLRHRGSVPVEDVDANWAQGIRDSVTKTAREGHTTVAALKADQTGIVWVYGNDGRPIGHFSGEMSRAYASAFKALARTKRHGLVRITVEPVEFKSGGATWVHLAPPEFPSIPANQPPEGLPSAGKVEFEVKDESKFSSTVQALSRDMRRSPAFFVIGQVNTNGEVPVFAPLRGRNWEDCQVGFIDKAGTKKAAKLTSDGPVVCPGAVLWRDRTPQIELGYWMG